MKLMYMGTPEFAVEPLRALIAHGYEVCAVITQPDKPKNRGMKKAFTPVKMCAVENNLPVWQPDTLKNDALLPILEQTKPDVIVVAAYGKLLPMYVLEYPRLGCINIHASLLPRWRGAAPIQCAVIEGDRETGVTIMHMAKAMDTGDIILQETLPIRDTDTSGDMHAKLAILGSGLIVKALEQLEQGCAARTEQGEEGICYAPMMTKEMGEIDWSREAKNVGTLIRGCDPWPAAYTTADGVMLKMFEPTVHEDIVHEKPGTILSVSKDGAIIACGEGTVVRVASVQACGGKRMSAWAYFNGHPIKSKILA